VAEPPADPSGADKVVLSTPLQITDAPRGRCISCGYLAGYREAADGTALSLAVSLFVRQSGPLPATTLWCFKQATDLQGEVIRAAVGYGDPSPRIRDVLELDRGCRSWYRYLPGFTPKEHAEQERMDRVEDARQAHETRLAQLEADIQANGVKIAKATKRLTFGGVLLAIVVVLLTAASLVATVYFGSRPINFHAQVQVTFPPTSSPTR
jgi:hypothetical protein